jgi:predicted CoA-binding protein
MEGEACPMPRRAGEGEKDAIGRMLSAKRIAVVGLSDDPGRTSNAVGAYLKEAGYEIVPVNPNCERVFGVRCLGSLAELKERVDVVLVFRRSEYCAEVAEEAVGKAKGIWLQSGIRNGEARRAAVEAGMDYVEDRCMMVEHARRRHD